MNYSIEVYARDGERFRTHHTDGLYDDLIRLRAAMVEAMQDDEVGSIRVNKL